MFFKYLSVRCARKDTKLAQVRLASISPKIQINKPRKFSPPREGARERAHTKKNRNRHNTHSAVRRKPSSIISFSLSIRDSLARVLLAATRRSLQRGAQPVLLATRSKKLLAFSVFSFLPYILILILSNIRGVYQELLPMGVALRIPSPRLLSHHDSSENEIWLCHQRDRAVLVHCPVTAFVIVVCAFFSVPNKPDFSALSRKSRELADQQFARDELDEFSFFNLDVNGLRCWANAGIYVTPPFVALLFDLLEPDAEAWM